MKKFLLGTIAAVTLAFSAGSAKAVIWGVQDDLDEYPYVGAVFTDEGNPLGQTVCSGVLLDDDALLTAAHCVDEAVALPIVTFGSNAVAFTALALALPVIHPDYNAIQDGPDVAILKLFFLFGSAPATAAQLPLAGYLDGAATERGTLHDRIYTTVGYGISGDFPNVSAEFFRQIGDLSLISVNSAAGELYAQFSSNTGVVSGGACLGDSGGPVFAPDGVSVVGVNSFGVTENCVGTGFASRIDIQEVLDFINNTK